MPRARVREGERERPSSPTGLSLPISAPSCVYTPVRSFVFAYRPLVPRLFLSPVALAVLHRLLSHPPLSPLPLVFLAPEAMHLRRTLTSPLRLLHEVRSVLLVEESRPLLFSAPLACLLACLLASSLLTVCFFFFSFFLTPSLFLLSSTSIFSGLGVHRRAARNKPSSTRGDRSRFGPSAENLDKLRGEINWLASKTSLPFPPNRRRIVSLRLGNRWISLLSSLPCSLLHLSRWLGRWCPRGTPVISKLVPIARASMPNWTPLFPSPLRLSAFELRAGRSYRVRFTYREWTDFKQPWTLFC